MKCNHCGENFVHNQVEFSKVLDPDKDFSRLEIKQYICPGCEKSNIFLDFFVTPQGSHQYQRIKNQKIHPLSSNRMVLPDNVPQSIREDYDEACMVLEISSKASAALSRRCLQNILIECQGGKPKGNLNSQIQTILDNGVYPSYIADDIDNVRVIGNFAAHPKKSLATGEILDVEPGEAEWNINTLEALFDFHFIARKKAEDRKKALAEKVEQTKKQS